MMNCDQVKEKLIELIDGTLSDTEEKAMIIHLRECPECRKAESELRTLLGNIDRYEMKQPDTMLDDRFEGILEKEEEDSINPATSEPDNFRFWSQANIIQLAASLLLISGAYLFGIFQNTSQYQKELETMKEEVALSLMESNSASKRIQAVAYSQELNETNTEILDALINMMNNDYQVNVRLAAANALAGHIENGKVREALIELLEKEANPIMQLELIQILVNILDDRITPSIRRIQEDENTPPSVKKAIVEQAVNRQS